MPKINKILLKLENLHYDTSLDFNTGYYHIKISQNISNLCKIIITRGKYFYKKLPTGISNPPEIFQQRKIYVFNLLEFIRTYIDDFLVLTKEYCAQYVQKIELTLSKLKEKVLKYNIVNSFFRKTEI